MTPGLPKRVLVLCAFAVPFAAAFVVDAPLCPTAGFFDRPCPGCGLTRATLSLLSGDFGGALSMHPLVFVIAPLYIGAFAVMGGRYLTGNTAPVRWITSRGVSVAAGVMLAVLLGVWGARFAGYLGGPAEVMSYEEWWQQRGQARAATRAE